MALEKSWTSWDSRSAGVWSLGRQVRGSCLTVGQRKWRCLKRISSSRKSVRLYQGPRSSTTTDMPASLSSFAATNPEAPAPTIQTSIGSVRTMLTCLASFPVRSRPECSHHTSRTAVGILRGGKGRESRSSSSSRGRGCRRGAGRHKNPAWYVRGEEKRTRSVFSPEELESGPAVQVAGKRTVLSQIVHAQAGPTPEYHRRITAHALLRSWPAYFRCNRPRRPPALQGRD